MVDDGFQGEKGRRAGQFSIDRSRTEALRQSIRAISQPRAGFSPRGTRKRNKDVVFQLRWKYNNGFFAAGEPAETEIRLSPSPSGVIYRAEPFHDTDFRVKLPFQWTVSQKENPSQ